MHENLLMYDEKMKKKSLKLILLNSPGHDYILKDYVIRNYWDVIGEGTRKSSWYLLIFPIMLLCNLNDTNIFYDVTMAELCHVINIYIYRQVSNIRHTFVGNQIVDHSDVVGASPVGAAATTSSFST